MGKFEKVVNAVIGRAKSFKVPKPENSKVRIGLGILNFFLPGVGTIIASMALSLNS